MFNAELIEVLKRGGWTDQRKVDLDCVRVALAEYHLPLNRAAESLLEQLHGLSICSANDPMSRMTFDSAVVLDWLTPHKAKLLHNIIGKPLCPIAFSGCFTLVSENFEVVLLGDDWSWYRFYSNIDLAFSVLLLGYTSGSAVHFLSDDLSPVES